jgi:hypothetical protein
MSDIELSFEGAYDQAVVTGTTDGGNAEFQSLVQSKVDDMLLVLRLQPGINQMASFVEFNGTTYKLNVREI